MPMLDRQLTIARPHQPARVITPSRQRRAEAAQDAADLRLRPDGLRRRCCGCVIYQAMGIKLFGDRAAGLSWWCRRPRSASTSGTSTSSSSASPRPASYLFVPFIMQWSIGSYVTSSGVMLWALLAPIGVMMFQGPRESLPWFFAYIVMTAVSGFFDYYLATAGKTAGLPMQTIAVFFVLNFAAMSTIVYLLVVLFRAREGPPAGGARRSSTACSQSSRRSSERLLLNVLPAPHRRAPEGRAGHHCRRLADVTVMFADLIDFTRLAEELPPQDMVELLNEHVLVVRQSGRAATGWRKSRPSATPTWSPAGCCDSGAQLHRGDRATWRSRCATASRAAQARRPASRSASMSASPPGRLVAGVIGVTQVHLRPVGQYRQRRQPAVDRGDRRRHPGGCATYAAAARAATSSRAPSR